MSTSQISYTSLINSIIKGDSEAVYLHKAQLQQTTGNDPCWFVRVYIHINTPEGLKYKGERVYLGRVAEVPKRRAETLRRQYLDSLSRKQTILQSQLPFGQFLDIFLRDYVRRDDSMTPGSARNYEQNIENHIRPYFGARLMHEITMQAVEQFFSQLRSTRSKHEHEPMALGTKKVIKGQLQAIFAKAEDWGYWAKDVRNPVERAFVGKERRARAKHFLRESDIAKILAEVPAELGEIIEIMMTTTMRLSEVLGLTWEGVDFTTGEFHIFQTWYQGDLGDPKTQGSERRVPMGKWRDILALRCPGQKFLDQFVFNAKFKRGKNGRTEQALLKPLSDAAKKLGLYYKGFGFRAFRRQAITNLEQSLGMAQTMKLAGHTKSQTTQKYYVLRDADAQEKAILEIQQKYSVGQGKLQ